MQILVPRASHLIPLTTDLFLLLIISSYHEPLYIIHTMISPNWSLVVSLLQRSFHVTTWTAPEHIVDINYYLLYHISIITIARSIFIYFL